MRTNVVLNDHLMAEAQKAGGLKTKKATIEAGLKLLVQLNRQQGIRNLRGKVKWEANLDEMRTD